MVKHVVLWKLKPEASATPEILEQNISRQMERFRQMQADVPEILNLEVFRNFKQGPDFYEFMVVMDFASREALEAFQHSPSHTDPEARAFGQSIRERKAVIDYEI